MGSTLCRPGKLVVRCRRILPIRWLNLTTNLLILWSHSPEARKASIRIRPLEFPDQPRKVGAARAVPDRQPAAKKVAIRRFGPDQQGHAAGGMGAVHVHLGVPD